MKHENEPNSMPKLPKIPNQVLNHKQTRTKQKNMQSLQPRTPNKTLTGGNQNE